jgi:glutaredoxin 3
VRYGIAFEEIDLGRDPERCCALEERTGGKSTPQIVLDGRPAGGYRELAALAQSGRLNVAPAR